MLSKKILLFNQLTKFTFFYRITQNNTSESNLLGFHNNSLFFDIHKVMYFLLRLTPFFLNLVKKKGCLSFIGVNFILLKWFQQQSSKTSQNLVLNWKAGILTNFFKITKLSRVDQKSSMPLSQIPISFFFLNFEKYNIAFKEINKFNIPVLGLFKKKLNPTAIYSIAGLQQSLFINCFFFKLCSRLIKRLH
jgi:ribosomal protein S2